MTNLDIRYRSVLLPHVTELRRTRRDGGMDLNMAEEILARHGLRDLDRATRILSTLEPGVK